MLDAMAKSRSREPVKNTVCARAIKLTLIRFILLTDSMPEPNSRDEPCYVETSLRTDDWQHVYVTMLKALTSLPVADDGSLDAFFPANLHPEARALGELDAFGQRQVDMLAELEYERSESSVVKRHASDGISKAATLTAQTPSSADASAATAEESSVEMHSLADATDGAAHAASLQHITIAAARAQRIAAAEGEVSSSPLPDTVP